MFLDQITIRVEAGKGGDGATSFRREKYVPQGGPDGGDGGRGGHVIFETDEGLTTLHHLRYQRKIKAQNGMPGAGVKRTGKSGEDVVVKVPVGTIIRDHKNGRVLADLSEPGDAVIIAKGGRGGRGNARFAGPSHQAPKFSERGEPGEAFEVDLELKLLADVGFVGLPNAGKSTLLSVISAAKPKIADYPFTTLVPNLGVVSVDDHSFVAADIPGLIEGAHQGAGLGHEFLRHIERTRLLWHVVDLSGWEQDPLVAYDQINQELASYKVDLSQRPQLVVANKMDLPEAQNRIAEFTAALTAKGLEVFPVSAATGSGIPELLRRTVALLAEIPRPEPVAVEVRELEPKFDFAVVPVEPGVFRIDSEWIARRLARFNMDQEESQVRFAKLLKRWGVEDALQKAGIKEGDTVFIGETELVYSNHTEFYGD
ncbi:MAG TPA: GTPase ObgE [Firmicutes bacterium]|nr:GTPase ObgE [Bacillota bacterium]HOQ24686.1 GTPase ObgE [Bacillota bacterium]HPT68274.1 GTPase ObgE [Bacillota bacterium]